MNLSINYRGNKGFRLLSIYERLNKGELLTKDKLAIEFGVSEKTIQRDIDDLRAYIAETHFSETEVLIKYDKSKGGYYLVRLEREWLTNEELLALCKILLESRAFQKEELNGIIGKLMSQVVPNDRKTVGGIVKNELSQYIPLKDREFRKRLQFMYSCELQRVTFEFSGPSLEAVLDRIPSAEIISDNDGVYKICDEVYGRGIQMWLRSQGDWIKNINL